MGRGGPGPSRLIRPLDLLANVNRDAMLTEHVCRAAGRVEAQVENPGNGPCGHECTERPSSPPSSHAPFPTSQLQGICG